MEELRVQCSSNGHNTSNILDNITTWNMTFQCWREIDPDMFEIIMQELNRYLTPVIIFLGVSGNLLSFLVFVTTHVREQSSNIFLASLALADAGFLITLLFVWLSWIHVAIFHKNVWCQLIVYFSYVFNFLSVWLVTCFTVDRYIIVCHPLRKDLLCNSKVARRVICFLFGVAFLSYSFATWTTGVIRIHTVPFCMPLPEYFHFYTIATSIDSCISLFVPSVVVIVLNIRIFIRIRSVRRSQSPRSPLPGVASLSSNRAFIRSLPNLMHERIEMKNTFMKSSYENGHASSASSISLSKAECQFVYDSQNNSIVLKFNGRDGSKSLEKTNWDNSMRSPESGRSCLKKYQSTSSFMSAGTSKMQGSNNSCNASLHSQLSDDAVHQKRNISQSIPRRQVFTTLNAGTRMLHSRTQLKTARMLIIVSSVFVLLNLPSHIFRIYAFIQNSLFDETKSIELAPLRMRWQEIFQLVYHMNFSINFFIYSFCSRKFRMGLSILYKRISNSMCKNYCN